MWGYRVEGSRGVGVLGDLGLGVWRPGELGYDCRGAGGWRDYGDVGGIGVWEM